MTEARAPQPSPRPPDDTVGLRGDSRPKFLASSIRVLELTLGEMLWSRRTVFMLLVVGGPVLIACLLRLLASLDLTPLGGDGGGSQPRVTGPAIFGLMVWGFYLRFTVPVLGVFYGTSLIADEVEDKTITYLFTRPVSRGAVLVGKYLGYLVCTSVVVLPSVTVVYFVIVPVLGGSVGENFPTFVTDLGLLVLGLAVYGALFAFVGAWFKHPLLTGLIFVFGWEPATMLVPGYMKSFTVSYYLQGLVPHAMPQEGAMSLIRSVVQAFQTPTSVWSNLAWLVVIWLSALVMAVWAVEHREYVLEQ